MSYFEKNGKLDEKIKKLVKESNTTDLEKQVVELMEKVKLEKRASVYSMTATKAQNFEKVYYAFTKEEIGYLNQVLTDMAFTDGIEDDRHFWQEFIANKTIFAREQLKKYIYVIYSIYAAAENPHRIEI